MHPEGPPDRSQEPARFVLWVENACLAFAVNRGQRVTYWREEPLEIDAVFEGSWGEWAVEVKTGGFDFSELKGLLEFCRRNPKLRPLVITAPGTERAARHHGLAAASWEEFLMSGPPSSAKTARQVCRFSCEAEMSVLRAIRRRLPPFPRKRNVTPL